MRKSPPAVCLCFEQKLGIANSFSCFFFGKHFILNGHGARCNNKLWRTRYGQFGFGVFRIYIYMPLAPLAGWFANDCVLYVYRTQCVRDRDCVWIEQNGAKIDSIWPQFGFRVIIHIVYQEKWLFGSCTSANEMG